MVPQVLQLDIQGTPQAWTTAEEAALHYATGTVVWSVGETPLMTLRGGFNAQSLCQSRLEIAPIIAVRGQACVNLFEVTPTVTRRKLFMRDRHMCAYCGDVQDGRRLQAEHIVPESRGGAYSWTNLVSACRLSRSKTLPVHDVSEWAPRKRTSTPHFRIRSSYEFGLRVHRGVR